MKKAMLGMLLVALIASASAVDVGGKEIGITADLTYMTKYMWRGYSVFDSDSAWSPSLDFDLGGGFGAMVQAYYAGNSGHVNGTEYDYVLYYKNSVLDNCFKTDYKLGWRYYDYIDQPSKSSLARDIMGDLQEAFVEMEMPQLIGNGFVPHINYYYMWKARSGGGMTVPSGSIINPGINYNWTFEQLPDLPMTFSWDIVYNDGVLDPETDHDWSHMLWGLKTQIKCPFISGAKLTPAIYYQNSWEKTVNTRDHLFATISYSLKF